MIPTFDIKVMPRSDAVQVALIMGAVMRSGNGIPLLRCWPRLPPSAVIALQFQPAPVFFCPILSGKTSRPLPAPSQRYNTLDFASKVVCQGDAVPIGFPATKPPVSLDSSGQEGLSPSFGIHPKSKNGMCQNASTFHFAFLKCDRTLVRFTVTFLWPAWLPVSVLGVFVRPIESGQYSVCSQVPSTALRQLLERRGGR